MTDRNDMTICPQCDEECDTITIKYYNGVMDLSECCNKEMDND